MKKFLILSIALLLSLTLFVACSDDPVTTPTPGSTTSPDTTGNSDVDTTTSGTGTTTTTQVPDTSTTTKDTDTNTTTEDTDTNTTTKDPDTNTTTKEPDNNTTKEPTPPDVPEKPEDILSKLTPWEESLYFAFEDHVIPGAGSDRVKSVTIKFFDAVFNKELFDVVEDVQGENKLKIKSGFTWKLKINDQVYTINNIGDYYFVGGNAYLRLDVASHGVTNPVGEYTIRLIIDKNGSERYYADLGKIKILAGLDPDADVGVSQNLTGVTGPQGSAQPEGEDFNKLFDKNVNTKLCTDKQIPIVFKTDAAVTITSYSLVAGNDNNGGRRITAWTLYGSDSENGEWTEIDKIEGDPLNGLDNFTEYNFEIAADKQASYQFYKLEYTKTNDLVQFSEIKLYVKG